MTGHKVISVTNLNFSNRNNGVWRRQYILKSVIKLLTSVDCCKTVIGKTWSCFIYEVGTKSSTLTHYKNMDQINNSKNAASEWLLRQMCD